MALTPAERQRRKRARQLRPSPRRLSLELDESVVDDVLRLAGLKDSDDPREVNASVAEAVEQLARRQLEAAVTNRMSRVTTSRQRTCYGSSDGDE